MCKLKSGIVLKNRVFVPEYDSHTEMLEELGIKDDYLNASKTFVRVELSPTDGDVFSDIDTWKLNVDQDIMPEWYDEDIYKPQVVKAVKEWAKDHIHIGVDNLKISTGRNHCIKDCKDVDICGSAMVKYIHGNATVEYIHDNATVENIFDSATVKNIYGKATVKNIYYNATVENISCNATVKYIYDNATVKYIHDNATVENIFGNATVKNIFGNATVKNISCNATVKNIYGNATAKNIYDDATVKNIFGNATVKNIFDSATVKNILDSATVKNVKGMAIIIGSEYGWKKKDTLILAENATFKDCQTKTIYQSGDWKLVSVENKNKV